MANSEDGYPTIDEVDAFVETITPEDIEILQASIFEAGQTQQGRASLECKGLHKPPRPEDIQDVYSPFLGDVFHAMDRPYVPVQHESKKTYLVAFQNAFLV